MWQIGPVLKQCKDPKHYIQGCGINEFVNLHALRALAPDIAQKMKFFIKDYFSKYDQICSLFNIFTKKNKTLVWNKTTFWLSNLLESCRADGK